MQIKEIEKSTLLVETDGELDHHSAKRLRREIDVGLDNGARNVLFDFSRLSFMDSSGIGMIMGRYKRVNKQGGRVVIAAPRPQVRRIIEMSGLMQIVTVEANVKKAIKKL